MMEVGVKIDKVVKVKKHNNIKRHPCYRRNIERKMLLPIPSEIS